MQLQDVYNGKSLYVEYSAVLEVTVKAGFSYSNGDSVLRLSENIIPWRANHYYASWCFHKVTPWAHRVEKLLLATQDTGLRHKWVTMSKY